MMIVYSWLLTLVFLVFVCVNLVITKIVAGKNLEVAAARPAMALRSVRLRFSATEAISTHCR